MTEGIKIPEQLMERAKDGQLVVFVGAGLSKRFGFPLWEDLILTIINEVEKEDSSFDGIKSLYLNKKLDLFGVLDILKDHKKTIRRVLEQTFNKKIENEDSLSVITKLINISSKIITTNYDKVIETVMKVDPIVDDLYKLADISKSNTKEFVFKIHGTISSPTTCVLTKEDYQKIYGEENAITQQLKNLALNNTFLFVGFSMEDPYVREIFNCINLLFDGYNEKAYLITTDNSSELPGNFQKILFKDYNYFDTFLENLDSGIKKKK